MKKRDKTYWRNIATAVILSGLFGFLFLLYVGHPYYLSRGITHPKSPEVCCLTPADFGLEYEEVSYTTPDDVKIKGWYVPSQNQAAVLLLHSIGANRIGVLTQAEMFAKHGYGVLLIDIRVHGESGGDALQYGGNEFNDVVGGVTYLTNRPDVDAEKIGVMGFSLGAQIGIFGAAQDIRVKAIAADAPGAAVFSDWPSPQEFKDYLYVPYDLIFFQFLKMHGGVDEPIPLRTAIADISPRPILLIGRENEDHAINELATYGGEPIEVLIIPGKGHIDGFVVSPEEYEQTTISFFDKYLLNQ